MKTLPARTNRTLSPWFFNDEFDSALDRIFRGSGVAQAYAPAVDLHETEDAYVIEADLPGMKKDDIHIEVLEDTVTIQGTRKSENEEKRENYHRIERHSGEFKRSFRIPGGFDASAVKAAFNDGVLTLNLPKQEVQKAQRISVN